MKYCKEFQEKCGIGKSDLLTKLYVSSEQSEKQRLVRLKENFNKMGKIKCTPNKDDTIDANVFIREVYQLQEMGVQKSKIASILGMNDQVFAKKYKLFKKEIDTYKTPKNIKKQLNERDIEFLDRLREVIKKRQGNKSENVNSLSSMSEIAMIDSYLKLKDFFLEERNKNMFPEFIGYIDEEEFFNMLLENPKMLTHSINNKIRPITELLDKYYVKSQTNIIVKGFPRIYGTSYERLTCSLEIVKDEDCQTEMLDAPKNYMCSPERILYGIKRWKTSEGMELKRAIISKGTHVGTLPEKYQNILDSKKKRRRIEDSQISL